MKVVKRYECEYCKKVFKINKHFCFKDPKNRACASCKNYLGPKQETDESDRRFTIYWCGYDNDNYVIYDSSINPMTDIIPFRGKGKSRGYDCEWWTPRVKTGEVTNDES